LGSSTKIGPPIEDFALQIDDSRPLFAVDAIFALLEVQHLSLAVVADRPTADNSVARSEVELLLDDASQGQKLLSTHVSSSSHSTRLLSAVVKALHNHKYLYAFVRRLLGRPSPSRQADND
jgi:hypothetical protein